MTDSAAPHYAGYRVLCDFPLSALPGFQVNGQDRVLRIRRGSPEPACAVQTPHWRHRWRDIDGSVNLQVAALAAEANRRGGRYLLQAPEQGGFLLDPSAATIAVRAPAELAANTLEHLLLDQAIPRLLDGRGHLVVHASIVKLRHHTIAFVGRSGWGKSTLAALLHRRGFPALCDDCALIARRGDRAVATPSYPGFRLYADSIDAALGTSATAGPVSDYTDKQRIIGVDLPPELRAPQPLDALYLLDDPALCEGVEATIDSITPAAACMTLVEHGFRLDPSDGARTVRLLAQASAVVQTVPVFLLRHPRDFARQRELTDLLLNHAASLTGPPA